MKAKVTTWDCPALNPAEVERLFDFEINRGGAIPTGEPITLSMGVWCEPDGVRISTHDQLTGKRLERTIPPIPKGAEPARVVALAASQLLRASWLELVMPAQPSAAAWAPSEDRTPSQVGGSFGVEGGARFRSLGGLLPVGHVGLRGGGVIGTGLILHGNAAFEYGAISRHLGSVSAYAIWIGLDLGYRFAIASFLGFDVEGGGGGGYVLLSAKRAGADVVAHDVDGLTGEIGLRAGPVFSIGASFLISIVLQGGYTIDNPVGRVDGESDVSIGGFSAGALLGLGLRFD